MSEMPIEIPREWFTVLPANVVPIEWARVIRMQRFMAEIEEQMRKACGMPK